MYTKKEKPKLIVILGPTASGKTMLALNLAKFLKKYGGAEIVSADSCQIYKGMNIGTAKPTKEETKITKHYLIDIKKPNEDYSVAEFKKDAIAAINKIIKNNKIPILVGGTGLYISALTNNWEIPEVQANKKIRKKIEREIREKGLNFVFKKLIQLDPEAAYIIDPKNPRRIIRAMEVTILTGKPFTKQRKKGEPVFNILEIGLNPPLKILRKKIEKRTKLMIKNGLVKEVKKLIKKYGEKQKPFDSIGYREIKDYLKRKITLEEAEKQIILNTWHFAKRQMAWFKKYHPNTYWIKSADKYKDIKKLIKKFI